MRKGLALVWFLVFFSCYASKVAVSIKQRAFVDMTVATKWMKKNKPNPLVTTHFPAVYFECFGK